MANLNKQLNLVALGRQHARVLASIAVGMIIGASVVWLSFHHPWQDVKVANPPTTDDPQIVVPEGPTMAGSAPTQISIPAVGITAPFEEPLGLMENNEIEVPDAYDTVGWYQYGPTPGELGPAVVLGHVDSVDGPAIFYSLGKLEPGNEIDIARADGTTATFIVERLERHEQSDFPTELVYSDIDHAGLRLITCSGDYDQGSDRYTHNLIVFARLASSTQNTI